MARAPQEGRQPAPNRLPEGPHRRPLQVRPRGSGPPPFPTEVRRGGLFTSLSSLRDSRERTILAEASGLCFLTLGGPRPRPPPRDQTDPGTSPSPPLSSRQCPRRIQSRVRGRTPGRGRPSGAGRERPSPTPAPPRPPRSPRRRRRRRHGGADGSGESHRDGLPPGTRVREPL